jgi:hypothetical protein
VAEMDRDSPVDFLLPRWGESCRIQCCAQSSGVPSSAAPKPASSLALKSFAVPLPAANAGRHEPCS